MVSVLNRGWFREERGVWCAESEYCALGRVSSRSLVGCKGEGMQTAWKLEKLKAAEGQVFCEGHFPLRKKMERSHSCSSKTNLKARWFKGNVCSNTALPLSLQSERLLTVKMRTELFTCCWTFFFFVTRCLIKLMCKNWEDLTVILFVRDTNVIT